MLPAMRPCASGAQPASAGCGGVVRPKRVLQKRVQRWRGGKVLPFQRRDTGGRGSEGESFSASGVAGARPLLSLSLSLSSSRWIRPVRDNVALLALPVWEKRAWTAGMREGGAWRQSSGRAAAGGEVVRGGCDRVSDLASFCRCPAKLVRRACGVGYTPACDRL